MARGARDVPCPFKQINSWTNDSARRIRGAAMGGQEISLSFINFVRRQVHSLLKLVMTRQVVREAVKWSDVPRQSFVRLLAASGRFTFNPREKVYEFKCSSYRMSPRYRIACNKRKQLHKANG